MIKRYGAWGLAASLACALPALAAEPDNFRQRLHHVAVAPVGETDQDIQAEIAFGREVAARVLGRYRLDDSDGLTRYVNLVGNAVALHAGRPELAYRFAVVESDHLNAYAAPGGYVFVTTGALGMMEDEAELAAVLAHEVAHVTQRHIVRELNIRGSAASADAGFARFLGGAGDVTRVAFAQTVDRAVEILFTRGLKKEDEFEADQVAVTLLAATGYDPTALGRYLERIARAGEGETRALSATHPSFDERLARLAALLEADRVRADLPTLRHRFREHVPH